MSNPKKVFGIDLGTTYSAIAYVDEHGQPVVVKNTSEDGASVMPSVVLVEPDGSIVVGVEAKRGAVAEPDRVFEEIKRSMGDPNFFREIDGAEYRPEVVSSYILKKLARYAATALGETVEDVVITVPAYFTESESQATRNAGQLAGLNVTGIITEPTAAAFAYGQQVAEGQTALVFDLGGGTFDVSIVRIESDARRVLVTGGDHDLGGKRWDQALVNHVALQFAAEVGSDPRDDPHVLQELWGRCEEAKRTLSMRNTAKVNVVHDGHRKAIEVTREKFDEITAHLLQNALSLTRDLIASAQEKCRELGEPYDGFDAILLVGGSTKMPQVSESLKAEHHLDPILYDPDEAVAKGAALYALKLHVGELFEEAVKRPDGQEPTPKEVDRAYEQVASVAGLPPHVVRNVNETRLANVLAHTIGVVVGHDRRVEKQVMAQTELPTAPVVKVYGTLEDNQAGVEIVITQGEGDSEADCTILNAAGNYVEVPPGLPAGAPVEVTMVIDAEGRLLVTVVDLTGGNKIDFEPERPGVMSKEAVDRMARAIRNLKVL